ncbi:DNA primase small subunit, partial [Spheniscus magellanicus]
EDLGMKHRLWVYSGRRGVHCWVCDDAVRKWSPALRAATVEYLTLVKVSAQGAGHPLPAPPRLTASVPSGRSRDCEEGDPLRARPPLHQHREPLQGEFPKKRDSVQRWELLKGRMERTRVSGHGAAPGGEAGHCCPPRCPLTCLSPQRAAGTGRSTPCYADWEIMLQYCFPRLDINVSKGVGHLLKSPFSVHPKTGRISVPLDLRRLDQFDPFAVPTIRYMSGAGGTGGPGCAGSPPPRPTISRSSLCHELDAAGDDGEQEDGGETEPKRRARGEWGWGRGAGGPHCLLPLLLSSPNPPDYKKTSLAPYVRVFEQFVEEMERARRGELLRRSGKCQAGM